MTNEVFFDGNISTASGSYSVDVTLPPSEDGVYYYQAFMMVYNEETGSFEEITSSVGSFYKPSSTSSGMTLDPSWLELPASQASLGNREEVTMRATLNGKNVRNYSIMYDPSYYASMWTAYHYCTAHKGSGTMSSWNENPYIKGEQVSVKSGYTTGYDRGHQIPNGSRNINDSMQSQTYLYTNSTPQRSNFNQNIWNNLENAERGLVSAQTDTVYVVTGPVYRKVGGNERVSTISQDGKSVPVPNYYYKAILKVQRNSNGVVTKASAIGFWMSHDNGIADDDYTNYVVSVDTIEEFTGFNFFANLPSSVESSAESNTSWSTFKSFSF